MSVDADSAAISFADGSSRQGDVVIGADGVHSVTRHQIAPDVQAKPSQHSAFRFLVREEEVLEDPRTRHLGSSRNAMWVWYAGDRKMVLYRCENNELMNFVCIHPGHLSKVDAGSYNTPVDKSVPLDIFKDFEPGLRGMLEKADPNSLRVYPLFDMDTLPTYVKGKMALLGDAAHPILPHLAQGGAMAIEDGVSLGVMLSNISSIEEVPARLQLYNDARYERDTLVQKYTRIVGGDGIEEGQDSPEKLSGKPPITVKRRVTAYKSAVNQYLQYPYSHDEHHASTAILLKYLWSKKPGLYWRQPVAFGPMPGPRQDFDGHPYAWDKVRSTTAKIVFQTSATLLRNLFPSEAYSFKSRDTVAIASLRIQSLGNLSWLGGQGYKLLSFHVHDVTYTAVDGKEYTGSYIPVVFENLADPIMTGREELGWPKVFSDLETHQDDDAFRASLSWRGTTWAEFSLPLVRASSNSANEAQPKTKQTESLLIHRQMPGVGDQTRVKADGAYASYYPGQEIRTKTLSEQHSPKPANISFKAHDWQKLPTLHHIVKGLEEIPILSVVESSIIEEEGSTDFCETTRIEV